MSELITRRTFLKATGAAALVAVAGSMLVGCGEGYGATPGNPTLPTIDNSTYANFGSFTVDLGPLSGQWTSRTTYESDGWRHNYLYTGLFIDNSYNTTSSVTIYTSNFTCKHNGTTESGLKVCSLGNFDLNDAKTGFNFIKSVTVPAGQSKIFPLYIDLGPVNTASFNRFYTGSFTITVKVGSTSRVFDYSGLINDPSVSNH